MPSDGADLLSWLPRLRRYARVLRRDEQEADDLVQDTLERAWARAHHWPGVADMRAWLFSIMHNLHVDALRRHRVETVSLDDEASERAERAGPGGAESGRALSEIGQLLDALPPEQRTVLLLVALEGMAYAEVAQALDIPIGTVMSRLSRGRERLRHLLDGAPAVTPPPKS